MTGGCLGDVVAALVDGELDHAGRERAHRHLTHCATCRAEVDGQRRLKARLTSTTSPDLPSALTDRLLRLRPPLEESAGRDVRPPSRPAVATASASRPAGSHPRSPRPSSPRPSGPRPTDARPRRALRLRASTGSAVALLGMAAALALGAPPRQATTPVDPASDAFVAEFVNRTADGSSSATVPAPAARTTGLTTFEPLTRTALLGTASLGAPLSAVSPSAGGARTTR